MSPQVELAVVGAGPAGIEAALTAASAGAKVALIDEAPRPGGQYYKQLPLAFASNDATTHATESRDLLDRLRASPVRLLNRTTVWGIYRVGESASRRTQLPSRAPGEPEAEAGDPSRPSLQLLALNSKLSPHFTELRARTLVLATGAYDRPIAFPGWTLPGVLTAGAVQILVKHQRVLPGRRLLLSGTGPLQLALADNLVRAGAEVVALLEAGRAGPRWLPHAPAAWGQWRRLREGLIYGSTLLRARVPLRVGWSVIEARGDGAVEEAVIARLDRKGTPIPGTEERLKVDTVVTGYGLLPNTMLSRMAGCDHTLSPGGDLVPVRDATLQTTLPGVYAVGDGAGIGGAELAQLEGRLAGLAVAHRLGHLTDADFDARRATLRRPLARQRRFVHMLETLFTPGAGLYGLATDETTICRCEEITLGEIRAAIREGTASLGELKRLTRAGMGNCQGRMCGALLARALVESAPDLTPDSVGALHVRPPLHPLRLSTLAQYVK